MRIVQTVRQETKVRQRHLQSLGPYDVCSFRRYRDIVASWQHLDRSTVVLEELAEKNQVIFRVEASSGHFADGEAAP